MMNEDDELVRPRVVDDLIAARRRRGLTQSEASILLDVSQASLSNLESRKNPHAPTLRTLQRYADLFGLEVGLVKPRQS